MNWRDCKLCGHKTMHDGNNRCLACRDRTIRGTRNTEPKQMGRKLSRMDMCDLRDLTFELSACLLHDATETRINGDEDIADVLTTAAGFYAQAARALKLEERP